MSYHYMFCHTDVTDSHGAFMHTSLHIMEDRELMKLLYDLGYWRAVILSCQLMRCGIRIVAFENVEVQLPIHEPKRRPTPGWPCPLITAPSLHRPFRAPEVVAEDDCVIRFGISLREIEDFFSSAEDILLRDPTGYEFPRHSST